MGRDGKSYAAAVLAEGFVEIGVVWFSYTAELGARVAVWEKITYK